MFEWRQEPCQFRDITDKVSFPKVTRNQTKPLRLKRKHTRKNRHASGLNETGSNCQQKQNKKKQNKKQKQKTDKTKRGAPLLGLAKSIY